ncbi:hypothetical protein BDR07DRAFT_1382243 [Suillus spraguei]|nr:hypothetical protein BDR07DRAFT_1382243 [Suillus spraguei]
MKTRHRRTKKCNNSPTSNLPLIAQVAKLFEPHDSDEDEETEEVDELQTLAECLTILKETKDKFVLVVKLPTEFIQDTHTIKKGNITVIQDTIDSIKDLHCDVSGVTEIAIAHELGELMYQQSDY